MDNKEPLKNDEKTVNDTKFKEGNPGGPGRPKGSAYMDELKQAIKEVEKEKKKSLFKRVIERAYISDSVMIAVLKKFVPDKVKQELEGLSEMSIKVEIINGSKSKSE